jgi:flavin-binding protein dodecin
VTALGAATLTLTLTLTACGYHFVGARPPTTVQAQVTSAAAEPGLPLLVRRALDLHGARLGLAFTDTSPHAPLPGDDLGAGDLGAGDLHGLAAPATLSVLIAQPQTRALVVGRASEAAVAATAYQVTLRASARCADHSAALSAEADYRDQTSPLSTDDARRDAIARAANSLGDQLAAWALLACVSAGASTSR